MWIGYYLLPTQMPPWNCQYNKTMIFNKYINQISLEWLFGLPMSVFSIPAPSLKLCYFFYDCIMRKSDCYDVLKDEAVHQVFHYATLALSKKEDGIS